jgi:hypothetical protein
MRDQGAVLSWALLRADNGKFTMSDAASVGKIALHTPAAAITDPGTETAFGKLDPTQVWQSVNANANFPTSARWMIAMFRQARHITVNGVIAVDVQTLTNILRVVGPVHVSDIHQTVTTSNVAPLLLYKLYLQYPAGEQVTRHDDITAVAQAAVHKMGHGNYDLGYFFEELAKASQGRHLLFYDTTTKLENASSPLVDRVICSLRAPTTCTSQSKRASRPNSTGSCTVRSPTTSRSTVTAQPRSRRP